MSIKSIDEYVSVNKRILSVTGLYPINYLRYSLCLFAILLIVVPQIFQLYLNRKDFSIILETSSVLSTIILAILKSFVWLWNPETPLLVKFMMTDYWDIARSFDDDNHMHGYAKLGKGVTRGYCFLIVNSLLIFFTVRPIKFFISKLRKNIDEDYANNFPFPAKYPKYFYESPFYELTYISQMLATTICGLVILAMDTLIASALFQTCGHFKIIRENLSKLNYYLDMTDGPGKIKIRDDDKSSKEAMAHVRKQLSSFIDHHRLVIRFSNGLERVFNPIMFLQMFASSLIICLVGFQVTSTVSENARLMEYSSYLVMALFQILLFCWPGGEMLFESGMIGHAAFSMKWYNASRELKMGVHFLILRSQKPIRLTAGKLYTMGMEQFCTILNTSLSYLMLLRSINSN